MSSASLNSSKSNFVASRISNIGDIIVGEMMITPITIFFIDEFLLYMAPQWLSWQSG